MVDHGNGIIDEDVKNIDNLHVQYETEKTCHRFKQGGDVSDGIDCSQTLIKDNIIDCIKSENFHSISQTEDVFSDDQIELHCSQKYGIVKRVNQNVGQNTSILFREIILNADKIDTSLTELIPRANKIYHSYNLEDAEDSSVIGGEVCNTKGNSRKMKKVPKSLKTVSQMKPSRHGSIKKNRDMCLYETKNKLQPMNHLNVHDGTTFLFHCNMCQYKTYTKKNLKSHCKIHTKNMIDKSEKITYLCNVCRKSFDRKYNLKIHNSQHTGEKPYTCDLCNTSFVQKNHLIDHLKTHSGKKPYSCRICKKTFNQNKNLRRHMKTHSSDRPYSCDVCHKTFIEKSDLFRHLTVHSGEKPYSCNICKKRYSQTSSLKRHLKIHANDKLFQ